VALVVNKVWFFKGAAASNYLYRRGYSGNISFTGAGISNRVISKVRYGNISFTGAGASNIPRITSAFYFVIRPNAAREINTASTCTVGNLVIRSNASKVNVALRGSIYFTGGIGAYNKVERRGYSGNISFTGAGISNRVISKVRYGNIHT
jgi:RTX toxin RtxA